MLPVCVRVYGTRVKWKGAKQMKNTPTTTKTFALVLRLAAWDLLFDALYDS